MGQRGRVDPVDQDTPGRRLIQPRDQLDHRGLAGAVDAHQGALFAGGQAQVQPLEDRLVAAGIAKGYILKHDVHRPVPRDSAAAALGAQLRLDKVKGVVDIQRLAFDERELPAQHLHDGGKQGQRGQQRQEPRGIHAA